MTSGRNDTELARRRAAWLHTGAARPHFAKAPRRGQESVWDYPRPPVCRPDRRRVEVFAGNTLVARSERAIRVLETASPPTFYLPRDDVHHERLRENPASSFCEWKGKASYYDVATEDGVIEKAAWSYPEPFEAFTAIRHCLAFYPGRLACFVDGERVLAQSGGFYGGWITAEIVGPFKGDASTGDW